MVICEITVVPIGTGNASVSEYVAQCHQLVVESGLEYQLTPMSTIVEGSIDTIMKLVKEMHEVPFRAGASRVSTSLRFDERRDKDSNMKYKMDSVRKKLK